MKQILMLGMLLAFCGCEETHVEYSEVLTEPATVVDLVYMPSNHGTGSGSGISSSGSFVSVSTDIEIPEKYAVVFRCKHGKFIVDNQDKAKTLYQRLHRDQEVIVSYREEFHTVKDGDKIVVPKSFRKFAFIDAK